MGKVSISVTEAARNFSDCISRARYQGTTFVLYKNGVAVARIEPEPPKHTKGRDLGPALRKALEGVHLGAEEATAWARELQVARKKLLAPVDRWES